MPRKPFSTRILFFALGLLLLSASVSTALAASRTTFNNRALFEAELDAGSIVIDDYANPGYVFIQNNALMSAVLGETDYETTGFNNLNIVSNERYCAGCNGSFELSFSTTSATCPERKGVFGVGMDITINNGYTAFVTYGDGTTENVALPNGASFFGLTSPDDIVAVHFGLPDRGSDTSISFQIDNLTIGAAPDGCDGGGGGDEPSMSLTKTASPTTAIAGSNLSYAVVATNDGGFDNTNINVVDSLPAGATFVSATPSAGGSCTTPAVGTQSGVVSCDWQDPVSPGGSVRVDIVVRVCSDTACGSSLTNRASGSFEVEFEGPELGAALQMREEPAFLTDDTPIMPGKTEMMDGIPYTFPLAPDEPLEQNPRLGEPDGRMARIDEPAALMGLDQEAFRMEDVSLITPVVAQVDLSITKSDSPDPVIAGNILNYTLNVNNAGPSNAPLVQVTDQLDPLVTFLSATVNPPGPTCSHVGGVVTCDLGTMGAPTGQCGKPLPSAYTISIQVRVSELAPCSPAICPGSGAFGGRQLANTATVATGDRCVLETNGANNSATANTDVRAGADVLIDQPQVERDPDDVPAFDPADGATTDQDPGAPACLSSGDFLTITQSFHNDGPLAVTLQRDNAGPEFEAMHPAAVVGVPGSCVILQGAGTCNMDEIRATWDGEIAVGETIELSYRVRVRGGVASGTQLRFDGRVNYDAFNVGQNTATRVSAATVDTLDCPPSADPNRQLGGQVHLPILSFQGQDDVCRSWIEVQYIGCDPSKAVLVTWGEPGFCPPQSAGPLKVECTGLLNPGSTWNLLGAQIPTGAKSGILFKFTAAMLSDVGLDDDLGFDDVVADLMCETLFFGVVGDSDDYRRFKKAYNQGIDFAGINQAIAMGEGILAVEVLRHCPGDITPGVEVSSRYNGISGTHLGLYDPVFGGFGYYVPLVYAGKAGLNTVMYIQNGGLECSSVEIWFKAQDDCLRARICEIFALAPGESFQWDASDCVGPDWQGSSWLRSSQVMGIAVDIIGRDILMTYVGEPQPFNYVMLNEAGMATGPATPTTGEKVAFGPLVYSEYQGWDTGVQVMNLSPVHNAKVKAYFLDKSGDIITTLVDWICPRGSQTYFLPVVAGLPGTWVGSVRVESQVWWTPGTLAVEAADIVGVATLMKYSDVARTATQEAIAYNLLPEHKSYTWQVGFAGGGRESGVGLIAIPSLLKDLDGTGTTSEMAIMNLVTKPGFTDFAIYIYDQNGLLDFVCQKIHREQVEYIDLQTWGYVSNGFKGSAIISATFWEHEVFDGDGFFLRNLVGLGAVGIERTGTRLNEDIPGDEAAGSRGIPFAQDESLEACFGGFMPRCPGQPGWNPGPVSP